MSVLLAYSAQELGLLIAIKTPAMYIQYFWMKLFSGSGVTTSPCGVSGGGSLSFGLRKELQHHNSKREQRHVRRRRYRNLNRNGSISDLTDVEGLG
jgi:hypothetical protein